MVNVYGVSRDLIVKIIILSILIEKQSAVIIKQVARGTTGKIEKYSPASNEIRKK